MVSAAGTTPNGGDSSGSTLTAEQRQAMANSANKPYMEQDYWNGNTGTIAGSVAATYGSQSYSFNDPNAGNVALEQTSWTPPDCPSGDLIACDAPQKLTCPPKTDVIGFFGPLEVRV